MMTESFLNGYMPIYLDEFSTETAHCFTEEIGAYLLLMIAYWKHQGPLPDEDTRLAHITKLPIERWIEMRPTIAELFQIEGGKWFHRRLDYELDRILKPDPRRPPASVWRTLREKIFARDNYTCTYCGKRGTKLECDHIIPVSRGGHHREDNLTTSCLKCNRDKRDRLISEWRPHEA